MGDGDRGWWGWVMGDELAGDRVRDGMSSYQTCTAHSNEITNLQDVQSMSETVIDSVELSR